MFIIDFPSFFSLVVDFCNRFQSLTISAKSSTFDVWKGSEYASVSLILILKKKKLLFEGVLGNTYSEINSQIHRKAPVIMSEVYLESIQTSTMELFLKIVNGI